MVTYIHSVAKLTDERAQQPQSPPAMTRAAPNGRGCNRVFASPHLPVPIPQQSADDDPIEPCAPRDVVVATAWIIAWALTVFILANVIGSI
jgi:hypothetical protein